MCLPAQFFVKQTGKGHRWCSVIRCWGGGKGGGTNSRVFIYDWQTELNVNYQKAFKLYMIRVCAD